MKKSKKFLSILCAVCMVLAMTVPAMAADIQATPDARGIAYMDTKGATPEMRQEILEARRDIIYAPDQGWSVNGTATVVSLDGTVEVLPKFSDVFPGWNLGDICALNSTVAVQNSGAMRSLAPGELFHGNVNLKVTTTATAFYSFNSKGQDIEVIAATLPGEKYSAAIRNEDTNTDLAYKGNMLLGDSIHDQTERGVRYSCRASSRDTAGDSDMIVRGATPSTSVPLAGDTQKIFDFPVSRGYGYWKIAIQNTSSAECWFAITKDSPSGDVIYTSGNVPANDTLSFRSSSDSPLADGTYYVTVHSARGDTNLNGTLWYKFGTTYDDISD